VNIVIDTHLHLYPEYDLELALRCLSRNLARAAPGTAAVGVLVERRDCHVFAKLRTGQRRVPDRDGTLDVSADGDALRVSLDRVAPLWLLPGRQVVTRERVEVLLLGADLDLPDGMTAAETIRQGLAGGALPVIGWAPGKWFFGRKQVVQRLLQRFNREELLLGDSSLRPGLWGEPLVMRQARRRGFAVVAGSDPLPIAGEERRLGCYATRLEPAPSLTPQRGASFLRAALLAPGVRRRHCGVRCTPLQTMRLLALNARAKRLR
jgi:hypothetical protein